MPHKVFDRTPRGACRLLVATAFIAVHACGGKSPASPSPAALDRALPVRVETAHYTFHYAEGDSVEASRQEIWHEWALTELGVSPGRTIDYYRYRDRAHMQQVTGQQTNGWADPAAFAVHSIFPWDDHEPVHVLSALIGRPSDFFNEGIAVALSTDPSTGRLVPLWQGRPVHDWPRQYRTAGRLPSLGTIVETETFRKVDENSGYPIAGSFVRFMIDAHGMEAMRRFFTGDHRNERLTDLERRFADAFGVPLSAAEQSWLAFLNSGTDRAAVVLTK